MGSRTWWGGLRRRCGASYTEVRGCPLVVCAGELTCVTEHLGLIPPQFCRANDEPDSFMRAAPHPNDDETDSDEDARVADPLADSTMDLWNNTARRNREIFTEIFRPVPTNLIRAWKDYEVSGRTFALGCRAGRGG